MCGIFGLLGHITELKTPAEVFTSFQNLRGRGPDRSLVVYNPKCFLGFHRLAIMGIDIDGDQPFHIIDGSQTHYLLCNGEVYNFRELIDKYDLKISKTGSDCAIILPLLKLFNYDFKKLNRELIGEYSFAVVTFENNRLVMAHICTDPLSVRPLFYAFTDDYESMGFSSLLGGLSMLFPVVNRFRQKSILKWIPGQKPVVEEYWEYVKHQSDNNFAEPQRSDYEKVVSLVENAVRRRLISDRPVGCLLSGGLDSSLVCAIAAKKLAEDYPGKKLSTYSIGMKEGTDILYAKKVASHVNDMYGNISHEIIYFTPQEGLDAIDEVLRATETFDITTIRASVGQYLLGKHISTKTDVKVVLNGDGADEGQMGYLYFYSNPGAEEARDDHYRLLDEIHLFDGLRVDRAISCHGLEARVPFLDREVVDYFRCIPTSWKLPTAERMEKHFIRKAFSEVYASDPILPVEVLWRKKEAFSDGVSGKEKSWYQWVQEFLNNKVSDEEYESNKRSLHPSIVPPSKEAYYYMRRFRQLFGDAWNVIPHYWLPNWSGNISEPSARVLKVYNSSATE
jgi:asparagine synthase (glutamine-hydrolysing)